MGEIIARHRDRAGCGVMCRQHQEYHVVGELKKAIAACEIAQDYVTRDMLCVQLDDTEVDHAYWLEQQIRLIDLVGLQNYQQSQMAAGDKA